MKCKYSYADFKIGDKILTTNNEEGTVVAIKSVAYLNDKLIRKSTGNSKILIDLMPFNYDNTRHKGIWYSALTVAIQDKNAIKPTYYLIGVDFIEVKKIIKDNDINGEQAQNTNIIQKIKNFLFKIFLHG